MGEITGGELLLRSLHAEGVKYVWAIPDGTYMIFLEALERLGPELGIQLRLRRVLYRMYALLKVHLAEEDAYLGVLEHNLSPEEEDELARSMAHAMADLPS